MNARIQQLVLAIWSVSVLAASASIAAGDDAWVAWLALLALLVAMPVVVALQFTAMVLLNARQSAARVTRRVLLMAWMREVASSARVFGWQQPLFGSAIADTASEAHARGRGILLVHGFACTRGLWLSWMRGLRSSRRPFVALTLDPPWGPIENYIGAIDRAVAELERATDLPPVVVSHSMGGLAVRAWWQLQPPQRIHRLITLGTPHHGTWWARWSRLANVRQMRRSNRWLVDVHQREGCERRARIVCFWSRCDNIVVPAESAMLDGADNRELHGLGHLSMLYAPQPWDELQRCLAEPLQSASVTSDSETGDAG